MASLFRRSNGVYYLISFQDGRRIWRSTGCTTKEEALKSVLRSERRFQRQAPLRLVQFRELIVAYAKANLAPTTVQLYRSAIDKLGDLIGSLPLAKYTPQLAEEFKILRFKQVSPVKVNIDLRTLRAAFNVALTWNLLPDNPFKKCKQLRVLPKRPAYLSMEEFHKLIAVIDREWFKDLVRFAVATMMRAGEIVNLQWNSVDLKRRIIFVENTNEFKTKTYKARVVPMNEWVYYMLKTKARMNEKVFTFPDGKSFSVGYVSSRFKKYVRKAAVREDIHFHSLRHTGATWLVQKDVPIYTVQQLLGHSSIALTEIYSHLEVDHLRKPMEKLEGYFGAPVSEKISS